jgi:hypothetical protein
MDVPLGLIESSKRSNPRILTAFVYLNDVADGAGGETAFTRLVHAGVPAVQPRLGRLLVWPNVFTDEPALADRRMHHEARTLRHGVKYGANVWIRLRSRARGRRGRRGHDG